MCFSLFSPFGGEKRGGGVEWVGFWTVRLEELEIVLACEVLGL